MTTGIAKTFLAEQKHFMPSASKGNAFAPKGIKID